MPKKNDILIQFSTTYLCEKNIFTTVTAIKTRD